MICSDDFQASREERDKQHSRRAPDAIDECFLCGRPLKHSESGVSIHLRTDGMLFPAGDEHWQDPDSQGAFPVGSECAKKLPAEYRLRL